MREYPIGLDVSFLGSASGVGTVTAGLVQALIRHDTQNNYLLLGNALPTSIPEFAHQQRLLQERTANLPDSWQRVETQNRQRMMWVFRALPKLLKRFRPRVYHVMDGISVPPRPVCPIILTVHDIAPLTHPRFSRMRDSLAAWLLIPRALKRAEVIIADSHYTAKEIIAYYPNAESKVQVVYLGVDPNVFSPAVNRESLAEELAERHGFFSPRFLLCVVTLNPRRNLPRLLRAFANVIDTHNDRDVCLVVAGCRGWNDSDVYRLVRELGLETRVHFPGYTDEEELVSLYRSALALVHPPLLEGFGFPVLEAMACGTPVPVRRRPRWVRLPETPRSTSIRKTNPRSNAR